MKSKKITAESINQKVIGTEISGYKMESVNEFLDEIANQILENEEQIEQLLSENDSLKNQIQSLKTEVNEYQTDIYHLHEEKKLLTKEKLGDVDIFKTIKSMKGDIDDIKRILENLRK